jgi:hypothetical protein
VVLEFTVNEDPDQLYTHESRRGYEQLLRKLLALPSKPAIIQLHNYKWWNPHADQQTYDVGLFYVTAGEAQLGVYAQVRRSLRVLEMWFSGVSMYWLKCRWHHCVPQTVKSGKQRPHEA